MYRVMNLGIEVMVDTLGGDSCLFVFAWFWILEVRGGDGIGR
jgi:hypothetical protein